MQLKSSVINVFLLPKEETIFVASVLFIAITIVCWQLERNKCTITYGLFFYLTITFDARHDIICLQLHYKYSAAAFLKHNLIAQQMMKISCC